MPSIIKKNTSFHTVALNIIYIAILVFAHFYVPYIHELVYSFFNGLFLLISILIFLYINAILRSSSITHFSYLSLFCRISISIIALTISIIFIAFTTNTTQIIERDQLLSFIAVIYTLQLITMIVSKLLYFYLKPQNKRNIAFITDVLDNNLSIPKFLSEDQVNLKKFNLSETNELISYSALQKVEAVYIYIDSKNLNELEETFKKLCIFAFEIYWVLPESIFIENYRSNIKPVLLNPSPVNLDTNQYLLKRSLDVLLSILILLCLSPLIFLIVIVMKFGDQGPILYTQRRYGQHGKIFNMIKFRSMKIDSDILHDTVSSNDPRVTFIGKFLRLSSFDEIPQLINVLLGEMSLVGPRPHIISETNLYSKKILKFLTRHHVKPGITGLAQIRTRGKADSIELMQKKFSSDLEYINGWSLFLDIKILLNTPISLWKNRHLNT